MHNRNYFKTKTSCLSEWEKKSPFSFESCHSVLRKYWYFIKAHVLASILQFVQYPLNCFLNVCMIPATLYFLYLGTGIFQGTYDAHWKLKDADYFTYVLLGALVLIPNQYIIKRMPFRIGHIVFSGRLATLWTLPHSKIFLLCGNTLFPTLVRYLVALFAIICLAVYQGMTINILSSIFIAISLAICVGIYICLSVIATAILLIVRKGDMVAVTVKWLSTYFSGVFVPTEALPQWARVLSPFVPITHCLKITRSVLTGKTLCKDTILAFFFLVITMCLVYIITKLIVRYSIKYLKTSGALVRF